jgi:PKD repeat protein
MKATAVVDRADPSGLKVTLHVEWSSTHPSSLYDVDWGDGGPRDVGKDLDSLVHTYAKAGLYKVQVRENETSSTARAEVTVGTFPFWGGGQARHNELVREDLAAASSYTSQLG